MAGPITRILSDIHYGDRLSLVSSFARLRPLCAGIDALVLNGDTLDTRQGPDPAHTERCRSDLRAFLARAECPVTLLTGNHDPDLSPRHCLELAGGKVFVLHGDVLFENIVPWGRDAAQIGRRVREALAAMTPAARERLEERLAAFRRVAAGVRQRHQSERHPLKYALRLATDTLLPPGSGFGMLRAWWVMPRRAAALAARHRPSARAVVVGHTHRPGVWRRPGATAVVNTGSFTRPFGAFVADAAPDRLTVRRVVRRGGEFRAGQVVAALPL